VREARQPASVKVQAWRHAIRTRSQSRKGQNRRRIPCTRCGRPSCGAGHPLGHRKVGVGTVFLIGALAYALGPDQRLPSSRLWMALLVVLSTLNVGLGCARSRA